MEIFNTKWKVLIPIFKYPTKGLGIREISRLSSVSHPSVLKIINGLAKEGMVRVEKREKLHLVKGNFENEDFLELKRLYNLLSLKELTDFLKERFDPEVIMVFGSYSKGTDFEESDIDIYMGSKKFKINPRDLKKFEEKLARRIDIFTGNLKGFPDELKENIINGVKLWGWLKI